MLSPADFLTPLSDPAAPQTELSASQPPFARIWLELSRDLHQGILRTKQYGRRGSRRAEPSMKFGRLVREQSEPAVPDETFGMFYVLEAGACYQAV